ncbi:right-handed parallel beta-helix repeat-containing protein [Myxococcus sp. MxC21-1]|uniref:right-handed parallel beta-helix repeat-containing protein n=1 Tax=Myxococcus sp. MxC21-1 TaxID=3041439 RepID=UPI00292E0C1A|nr:right-handed parallel beta-helix repeat-containing protein [Myxococcus sp. MxC21-1]WNZ65060.1 right-handed parallel beta-helix repeat-containing protein [Myxococcus sp. MxC21-1]
MPLLMKIRHGNCLKLTFLATSMLLLSLAACSGSDSGGTPVPVQRLAPRPMPTPEPGPAESPTPTRTFATRPPVGVQAVAGTPVAALPDHTDHVNIEDPSPQPAVNATAMAVAAEAPVYTREWVVSTSGNDAGDGSAAQPLRTLNKAIGLASPGELIRVLPGTYAERVIIGDNAKPGTSDAKITLQGEGNPRIVLGPGEHGLVQVRQPHWIIDGFEIDMEGQTPFAVTFEGDVTGSMLVNSDLHGGTGGGAVTTFNNATGPIIENNHIHDFVKTTGNEDSHGVVVQPTSRDVTVRNNDIHDNSGDSVQCLGPEGFSNLPPAENLLVENNHFYGNRENAVDIKTCYGVTIRNNRMHHFLPTSTARGDVVVIHYSASNVLVEDNEIYDGAKGIAVGGTRDGAMPTGVVIRRNRVYDMTEAGGGEGTGIRLENSKGTRVVNNTVTRAATALIIGHGTGGPTQSPVVQNNIFAEAPIAVNMGPMAPGMKMGNNLFPAGAQFKKDGKPVDLTAYQSTSGDITSRLGSADLGAAFAPGPMAQDSGADIGIPFCGGGPDIGAVELGC